MAETPTTFIPMSLAKYMQTLLLALMTGILGWCGMSIQESNVKIAALTERVNNLTDQVQNGSSDRYRGVDAGRDLALRDDQIKDLRDRVSRLEQSPHR